MKKTLDRDSSQVLLQNIVEGVPIRVFWKDRDSRYLGCNTLFAKDAGLACPEELIGKTDFEMSWKDQAVLYRADDLRVMESGIPNLGFEVLQMAPGGKKTWLRTYKMPLYDTAQSVIGVFGTYEDITKQKLAEDEIHSLNEVLEAKVQERTKQLRDAQEELVRKEKLVLLGQVADTVGHELRNPLGVMNNAVYFLQTVLVDADETTKEYLGIIKDEIADAERIVSDLLDAVRTKPPHSETVVVAELMQQTLRKCNVAPSVTVRLDIPETIPVIQVDPTQMRQVFWNLITNGVEAMPEGGALDIRVSEDPAAKTVMISIKDSGSGIAPEHLARLFQPMFTTKARRVGLGLVVVKNLTQANGGSVSVESAPGKGSEFSVTLASAS
jgi:PAS domain S-box-containing protein